MSKLRILGLVLFIFFVQLNLDLKAQRIITESFVPPSQRLTSPPILNQTVFVNQQTLPSYFRVPSPIVRYNGIVTNTSLGTMHGQIDLNLYQPIFNKIQ